MRRILLAGASLLALLVCSPAEAGTVMFGYTGKIVPYIVPTTGTYQILAWGAEGGYDTEVGTNPMALGGRGAEVGGDISLKANDSLEIIVGQMGASTSGFAAGGGGGSFVLLDNGFRLLLAAGGGGGAGGAIQGQNKGQNGYAGQTGADGTDGFGTIIHRGVGGSDGGGGSGGGSSETGGGGAGAGVSSDGGDGVGGSHGAVGGGGGRSYPYLNGGASSGGAGSGGFGGGGGSGLGSTIYGAVYGGGGGGGGYSGGGGGQGRYFPASGNGYGGGGGGGGSYDGLTNQILKGGVQTGNGGVWITLLEQGPSPAIPEPSTWAMMATGFAALGLAGLRRRRKA